MNRQPCNPTESSFCIPSIIGFFRNLLLYTYPVNTTVWVSLTLVFRSTTWAARRAPFQGRRPHRLRWMESEREEQEEDGERRRREHESEHESDGGAERRVAQASAQRAFG